MASATVKIESLRLAPSPAPSEARVPREHALEALARAVTQHGPGSSFASTVQIAPACAESDNDDDPFSSVLLAFLTSAGAMPDSREQLKVDVRNAHQALRQMLPPSTTFTLPDGVRQTKVFRELVANPPHQKQEIYARYRFHFPHMGAVLALRPLQIATVREQAHLLAFLFISGKRPGTRLDLFTFIDDLRV